MWYVDCGFGSVFSVKKTKFLYQFKSMLCVGTWCKAVQGIWCHAIMLWWGFSATHLTICCQLKIWMTSFLNDIAVFFVLFRCFPPPPLVLGFVFRFVVHLSVSSLPQFIFHFVSIWVKCKYVNYQILCTGDKGFCFKSTLLSFTSKILVVLKKSSRENYKWTVESKRFMSWYWKKKKSSGRKFDQSGVYECSTICDIGVTEL